MKENEAKEKMCPLLHNEKTNMCFGRNCMAWTWNDSEKMEGYCELIHGISGEIHNITYHLAG